MPKKIQVLSLFPLSTLKHSPQPGQCFLKVVLEQNLGLTHERKHICVENIYFQKK